MGWGGNIGPNLDSAKPNYDLVLDRVTNGGGGMPAFKGELTEAQIKCISTVVATVSEGGGAPTAQAARLQGLRLAACCGADAPAGAYIATLLVCGSSSASRARRVRPMPPASSPA